MLGVRPKPTTHTFWRCSLTTRQASDEAVDRPRRHRTKIIATLGPASIDLVPELIAAGVDCFRLNFSHGNHHWHGQALERVRAAATSAGRHIGVLADLQGPKYRTTAGVDDTLQLPVDSSVRVSGTDHAVPSCADWLHLQPAAAVQGLTCGSSILLADGRLELEVVNPHPEGGWQCVVRRGGPLPSRSGVHLRRTNGGVRVTPTSKDLDDLWWGVIHEVDAFALSFVRDETDVTQAQEAIAELTSTPIPVVAKLELAEVLPHTDAVMGAAFGVMLARGDLGVSLPMEQLPVVQLQVIADARRLGRPIITATQMLETMVASSQPTRAEVSDVANAVFDGTDAVMLSGETAAGRYPVEAVAMMRRIILAAEVNPVYRRPHAGPEPSPVGFVDVLGKAVCASAQDAHAAAIVVYTQNGQAALRVAAHRPAVPICVFSESAATLRLLSWVWGVEPFLLETSPGRDEFIPASEAILRQAGYLRRGDRVVLTSKTFHREGPDWTSCMIVHQVE